MGLATCGLLPVKSARNSSSVIVIFTLILTGLPCPSSSMNSSISQTPLGISARRLRATISPWSSSRFIEPRTTSTPYLEQSSPMRR